MIKNKIFNCVLINFMFFVFATMMFNVNASSSTQSVGMNNTIYYFTDYYPTIDKCKLQEDYPSKNLILDHQYINSTDFDSMVLNNYFDKFYSSSNIVIIDIKTFMPDAVTLNNLFYNLKVTQKCNTSFVTSYNISDYFDDSFKTYLDEFICDNTYTRLQCFIDNSFSYLYDEQIEITNMTYLFDSQIIGDISLNWSNIIEHSPFFKLFIKKICNVLNYSYSNEFENIKGYLKYNTSMKIITLDQKSDNYIDLISGDTYYLNTSLSTLNETNTQNMCAFGFWNFSQDFYDKLYQFAVEESYNMQIFAFEVEEIIYGTSGLSLIDNHNLEQVYYKYTDDCEEDLLVWIGDIYE